MLTPLSAVDEGIEKLPNWAIPLRMVSVDLPKNTLERHFIFSEKALKNGMYANNPAIELGHVSTFLLGHSPTYIYV